MPSYPNRCQHIKVNGTLCDCPALRRNRFCYFHKRHHEERVELNRDRVRRRPAIVDLPVFEDANSIQVSLMQITRLLLAGQIDHRTAGLILYALQTASANLRHTRFEPYRHQVVLDVNAVGETGLGDYIWRDEDFVDEEEQQHAARAAAEAQARRKAAEREKLRQWAEAEADRLAEEGRRERAAEAAEDRALEAERKSQEEKAERARLEYERLHAPTATTALMGTAAPQARPAQSPNLPPGEAAAKLASEQTVQPPETAATKTPAAALTPTGSAIIPTPTPGAHTTPVPPKKSPAKATSKRRPRQRDMNEVRKEVQDIALKGLLNIAGALPRHAQMRRSRETRHRHTKFERKEPSTWPR